MRTTITLDPEAEALVKQAMADRKLSFKEVVNDAIVRGLVVDRDRYEFRTRPRAMGVPRLNLDKAIQLAGELEDEEILRKMALGK